MVFHADFWLSTDIYGKTGDWKWLVLKHLGTFAKILPTAETITLDFIT